jgi:hypothetical protein
VLTDPLPVTRINSTISIADSCPVDQEWAIVSFEHRESRFPFKHLKDGFRHCLCVIGNGHDWILIDPLKGSLQVETISGVDRNFIVNILSGSAKNVICGYRAANGSDNFSLRPLTCVELVKRAIGVDASFVLTPWQLYRRLTEHCDFVQVGPGAVERTIRRA